MYYNCIYKIRSLSEKIDYFNDDNLIGCTKNLAEYDIINRRIQTNKKIHDIYIALNRPDLIKKIDGCSSEDKNVYVKIVIWLIILIIIATLKF